MLRIALASFALAVVACAALAQDARPYAGMDQRRIKALSDQQVADLRAGRGMGLALPAELNGYPGPSHVIELADQLELSPEQLVKTRALFLDMKADAVPIGERLIRQQAELDQLFASKLITPESLARVTQAVGLTQAELRNAHLKYHLATVAVLTPVQVKRYGELRGYASNAPVHSRGHSHN